MDDLRHSYRVKAARYHVRAQTEQDAVVRAALRHWPTTICALAERPGNELALTVEFQIDYKPRHTLAVV